MTPEAKLHSKPQATDPSVKIIKKVKLGKDANLKITQNQMSGRIFVEFSSEDGKLVLQKSFQDTYEGNKASQEFAKRIKSGDDLKRYFGLIKGKRK